MNGTSSTSERPVQVCSCLRTRDEESKSEADSYFRLLEKQLRMEMPSSYSYSTWERATENETRLEQLWRLFWLDLQKRYFCTVLLILSQSYAVIQTQSKLPACQCEGAQGLTVINDRPPSLLWIGGPTQTIGVVGTSAPVTGAAGCRCLAAPASRCGHVRDDVLPFTLMVSLYRFSYAAMIKDTLSPLTAPPRSTCPLHNTTANTRLMTCFHWFFQYISLKVTAAKQALTGLPSLFVGTIFTCILVAVLVYFGTEI